MTKRLVVYRGVILVRSFDTTGMRGDVDKFVSLIIAGFMLVASAASRIHATHR